MKKLLLAGVASVALALASPALAGGPAQLVGGVGLSGTSCPSSTVVNVGNGAPIFITSQGLLCVTGTGGGGSFNSVVYGPTANGGSAANPPILVGGTQDNTGTGVISNWVVNSAGHGLVLEDNSAAILTAVQGLSQASTTSGQKGSLVFCAATTSNPTYTTGQSNSLSCDTSGNLRITAPASAPVNVIVNTPPNDVVTGPTALTSPGTVSVSSQGSGSIGVQATGTGAGLTFTFQSSVDGTNWSNVVCNPVGAAPAPTTGGSANGMWTCAGAGPRNFRVNLTAISGGTETFTVNASAGSYQPPSGGNGIATDLYGVGGTAITLGQKVAASSLPVVLPSATNVPVSQGTAANLNATVVGTGTFAAQATLQTQTDTVMVGGVNVKEFNGVTPLMGNGVSGTGSQRVNVASDNTAFSVNPQATTTTGVSVCSKQVANNTTSVACDASAGTAFAVRVFNNSTTIAYLKLYNAVQGSTTCGSGTPVQRIMIPGQTGGAGAVFTLGGGFGVAYGTAITACVTTGFADNDTTAPAANTYSYEIDYK